MLLSELETLVNREPVTDNMFYGQKDYTQKVQWCTALVELQNLAGNLDIPIANENDRYFYLIDKLDEIIGDNFSTEELYYQDFLIKVAIFLVSRYENNLPINPHLLTLINRFQV